MKFKTAKQVKNLLIQYKGGGYDGCHWEWNYFLFDTKGKFHDIGSSGYQAITTKDKALELLNKKENESWGGQEHYPCDLTSAEDLNKFANDTPDGSVAIVANKVNKILGTETVYWQCDKCETKGYDNDYGPFHTGYHGNGGVGIVHDGKLCGDCYTTCGNCGEYVDYESEDKYCGTADIDQITKDQELTIKQAQKLKTRDENCGPLCHYCAEQCAEDSKKEGVK